MKKVCSICHLVPPYKNSSRCPSCSSVYAKKRYYQMQEKCQARSREYWKANHDMVLQKQRKKLLAAFGLEKYGEFCDICGTTPKRKTLAIDHCHKTNKFRGFLCDSCNLGLGKFKDNGEILQKAIDYLQRNR